MTKPIRLSSPTDVRQYCNFLTDPTKQALVTYCTSTELKDNQGFLGDVSMLGSPGCPWNCSGGIAVKSDVEQLCLM